MQTSLLLPLILMATNGPTGPARLTETGPSPSSYRDTVQNADGQTFSASDPAASDTPVNAIFEGCRSPVLDTRLSSKILFERQVEPLHETLRSHLPDTERSPLFISRCGSEFVLFHRRDADQPGDILYLRFEEGSFELLDEAWG